MQGQPYNRKNITQENSEITVRIRAEGLGNGVFIGKRLLKKNIRPFCDFHTSKHFCKLFETENLLAVMYDTAAMRNPCFHAKNHKYVKLWERTYNYIFLHKNLPTQYTRFINRVGKKQDSIIVFVYEPPQKKQLAEQNFNIKTCFKDSFVWGVLDTNVIHTLPFKTGIFNTFAKPNTPDFDVVTNIDMDTVIQNMPYTIQFSPYSYTENRNRKWFTIKPVANPLFKGKICLKQEICLGQWLYPEVIHTTLCECYTGEHAGAGFFERIETSK
jgi:hypothetical protein